MKAKNVKIGMIVQMKQDYAGGDIIQKGMIFKVLKRQGKDISCFILDHQGEKSYLAPWAKQFRPFKDTEIIPDKTTLLISEDGVPLFEGDEFYVAVKTLMEKWELDFLEPDMFTFKLTKDTDIHTQHKYFSTKDAAISWIEAQQPKEIEVKLFSVYNTATVKTDHIKIVNSIGGGSIVISPSDIEAISNALKTLSK